MSCASTSLNSFCHMIWFLAFDTPCMHNYCIVLHSHTCRMEGNNELTHNENSILFTTLNTAHALLDEVLIKFMLVEKKAGE